MANIDISTIKDYDLMQHIRNIYNMIGAIGPDGLISKENIVSALDTILERQDTQNIWIGTQAKYDEGVGNGTIPDTMICIVTDDYYEVKDEDRWQG